MNCKICYNIQYKLNSTVSLPKEKLGFYIVQVYFNNLEYSTKKHFKPCFVLTLMIKVHSSQNQKSRISKHLNIFQDSLKKTS